MQLRCMRDQDSAHCSVADTVCCFVEAEQRTLPLSETVPVVATVNIPCSASGRASSCVLFRVSALMLMLLASCMCRVYNHVGAGVSCG